MCCNNRPNIIIIINNNHLLHHHHHHNNSRRLYKNNNTFLCLKHLLKKTCQYLYSDFTALVIVTVTLKLFLGSDLWSWTAVTGTHARALVFVFSCTAVIWLTRVWSLVVHVERLHYEHRLLLNSAECLFSKVKDFI